MKLFKHVLALTLTIGLMVSCAKKAEDEAEDDDKSDDQTITLDNITLTVTCSVHNVECDDNSASGSTFYVIFTKSNIDCTTAYNSTPEEQVGQASDTVTCADGVCEGATNVFYEPNSETVTHSFSEEPGAMFGFIDLDSNGEPDVNEPYGCVDNPTPDENGVINLFYAGIIGG